MIAFTLASALCASACGAAPRERRVEASYDRQTGQLSQLKVDAVKDGEPDIFSYRNGKDFVRIEIDNDEDGKIDRWEYYGHDQKVVKVGTSRSDDGIPDTWAFQSPDGGLAKIELSTRRDGESAGPNSMREETRARGRTPTVTNACTRGRRTALARWPACHSTERMPGRQPTPSITLASTTFPF